ncbi:MAG: GTP-binding protein [Gammaproteobacteria bacterium]|nr:GTP-binding protein [Gammaproteobacteria bacterium]
MPVTIPVTVIGGYLGAGKTTLVNWLLAAPDTPRFTVLVNDFGAINVDASLLKTHDGDTLELTNGCVCCSIADSLGDALDDALARRPQPEHILIEASGVSDPDKIAHYARGWPGCHLETIIVVADAETVIAQSRDKFVGSTVQRQLAASELLCLNKLDLVDVATIDTVQSALRQLAQRATIVPCVHSAISPAAVFASPRTTATQTRHLEPQHHHDEVFHSATIQTDEPISLTALEHLLSERPLGLWRVKGQVCLIQEDHHLYAVQAVGARWSIEALPTPATPPVTRLAFIGVAGSPDLLTEAAIKKSLGIA